MSTESKKGTVVANALKGMDIFCHASQISVCTQGGQTNAP